MIDPPPTSFMCGAAYFIARNGPIRLTRRISAQSSELCSKIEAKPPEIPALANMMSRRPWSATVCSTRRSTSASEPASTDMMSTPSVRSAATTVAPSERNRSAVASPIPEAAPVIIATLPSSRGMFGELQPGDRTIVHLIGPVGEPQRPDAGPACGKRRVLTDSGRAERLHRIVDDLQCHARRLHLDHRDLGFGFLVARLVHQVGGLEAEQPSAVDLDPRLGDALLPDAVLADLLAESDAALQPLAHQLDRFLG